MHTERDRMDMLMMSTSTIVMTMYITGEAVPSRSAVGRTVGRVL